MNTMTHAAPAAPNAGADLFRAAADMFTAATPPAASPSPARRTAPPPALPPRASPVKPAPSETLVPRDLVVRVGRHAGMAVYYADGQPMYKDRSESVAGSQYEVECEFILPHVAYRIMSKAPHLALVRDGAGYTCALKVDQPPQRGASVVEAVFRAFDHAKSQAKAA